MNNFATMNSTLVSQKEAQYGQLTKDIKALCSNESDLIANLANISAAIHYQFKFWWTGFYFVKGKEMVLGPFQGPIACTRIAYGKGVCGTTWKNKESIVVPNVHEFPGHIACSALSESEIVIPIFDKNGDVAMVLDIDSEHLNTFDAVDKKHLENICLFITELL